MRSRIRPQATLVIALAVLTIIVAGWGLGLMQEPELRARDFAFLLRGAQPAASRVVIVAIDDESFNQTQMQWPWSRATLAQLISQIASDAPRAIVLDVLLYEPANGDAELAQAIARAGNVILANNITAVESSRYALESLNEPVPALAQAAHALGLSNIPRDRDGFVRRVLAYQDIHNQVQYHWAIQAAALATQAALPARPEPNGFFLNAQFIPLQTQALVVSFRGPPHTIHNVPAYQVLSGEFTRGTFRDAVVMIGATTETLHDTYPTPFQGDASPMPGVEIGANALDTILARDFVYPLSNTWTLVLIVTAGFCGAALTRVERPWLALVVFGAILFGYVLLWFVLFRAWNWQLPLVAPVAALALCFAMPSVARAVEEAQARRRLRHLFEQFISPEMVNELIAHGTEGAQGNRAELTILLADMRGFTNLAEKMEPDALVEMLNTYLAAMTQVIFRHRGTIDKFEGDAILAFWGAPARNAKHAQDAVRAALEMQAELDALHTRWSSDAALRELRMGIGINTGEVFVGLVGSAQRVNYTVIGDAVNTASRIQDLTKEFGVPILISESTFRALDNQFDAEFVGTRTVKGKTVPVNLYHVRGTQTRAAQTESHAETQSSTANMPRTI